MADNIRMDSHKLLFHPDRVAAWQRGEIIYPIEMEIGLSGACNHRCIFCAVDYVGYTPNLLKLQTLAPNLTIMGKKGVKSIIFAGEGEPLVNPETPEIINFAKKCGMDTAMSTNAALFTKEKAASCLKSLSWVRVSIAGATDATYEKIHQCAHGDLGKVLANMASAADIKRSNKLSVTLGAQLLLLPENKDEVVKLAQMVREIGFDYFTVKPFSPHPSSKSKVNVDYSEASDIGIELKQYETEKFKIYFRAQSMENLVMEKSYTACEGVNFMAHMDAEGNVFPCVVYVGQDKFNYGNIYEKDFASIWESERARKIRAGFNDAFIHKFCRKACRLDEMNKYLHELKYPGAHVNFI